MTIIGEGKGGREGTLVPIANHRLGKAEMGHETRRGKLPERGNDDDDGGGGGGGGDGGGQLSRSIWSGTGDQLDSVNGNTHTHTLYSCLIR